MVGGVGSAADGMGGGLGGGGGGNGAPGGMMGGGGGGASTARTAFELLGIETHGGALAVDGTARLDASNEAATALLRALILAATPTAPPSAAAPSPVAPSSDGGGGGTADADASAGALARRPTRSSSRRRCWGASRPTRAPRTPR